MCLQDIINLHQNAIYHFNKQNYEVESIVRTKNGANVYLKKSNEIQKENNSNC